jgi:hypothetical protein
MVDIVMLRVIVCVALLASGCVFDPATTTIMRARVVKETVKIACSTEDQIKDVAVEASRATYLKHVGNCPCRYDTYERGGTKRECGELSAEAQAKWVMCRREQVPPDLVTKLKAQMPECQIR